MQTCEIRILPEAEDFLSILPQTLVTEGHLSTYKAAEKIVDDIMNFISQLPNVPHYKIADSLAYHFAYLGTDIEYAFSGGKMHVRLHGMSSLNRSKDVFW